MKKILFGILTIFFVGCATIDINNPMSKWKYLFTGEGVYFKNYSKAIETYNPNTNYKVLSSDEIVTLSSKYLEILKEMKKSKSEFETNEDLINRFIPKLEKLEKEMNQFYWVKSGILDYDVNNQRYDVSLFGEEKKIIRQKNNYVATNGFGAQVTVRETKITGMKLQMYTDEKNGGERFAPNGFRHHDIILPDYKDYHFYIDKVLAQKYSTIMLMAGLETLVYFDGISHIKGTSEATFTSPWEDSVSVDEVKYKIVGYRIKYDGKIIKEELFFNK